MLRANCDAANATGLRPATAAAGNGHPTVAAYLARHEAETAVRPLSPGAPTCENSQESFNSEKR